MALREAYEKARQNKLLMWIIIVFAIALMLIALFLSLYSVLIYPVDQVSQYGINNATERAVLINQYRTTSIQFIATCAQILGGTTVLIGIYFAWGNLITAREGQITERFTRAVDQLGNEKLEIRLGGIYALERISNESEKDYWPIMEILTAYVRKNSIDEVVKNKKAMQLALEIQAKENTTSEFSEIRKLPSDVQTILTTIGRRNHIFRNRENGRLELQGTNLQNADLKETHLEGVNFEEAHLEGG